MIVLNTIIFLFLKSNWMSIYRGNNKVRCIYVCMIVESNHSTFNRKDLSNKRFIVRTRT